VRLPNAIKRIDLFDIHIRLDQDLEADIKLQVVPDRELHMDDREDMEFDNDGELIEKDARDAKSKDAPDEAPESQSGSRAMFVPAEADN